VLQKAFLSYCVVTSHLVATVVPLIFVWDVDGSDPIDTRAGFERHRSHHMQAHSHGHQRGSSSLFSERGGMGDCVKEGGGEGERLIYYHYCRFNVVYEIEFLQRSKLKRRRLGCCV